MNRRGQNVNTDLVGFELQAISRLLDHWSTPAQVTKRKDEWEGKLPFFRQAIAKDINSGSHEAVPAELIEDDYKVILEAVHWVKRQPHKPSGLEDSKRWLVNNPVHYKLPLESGKPDCFTGPFPGPPDHAYSWVKRMVRRLGRGMRRSETVNFARKAENLARDLVAVRLGITESTVRNALNREQGERRFSSTEAQRQLASVFLDVCSSKKQPDRKQLLAHILDSLYLSGYHVLAICYLIRAAHYLKHPICVTDYDAKSIEKLCSLVRDTKDPGPFTKACLSGND